MSTEPGYAASRKKNGQITPYNPTQCAPSPRAMRTRDTTHGVLLGRTHRLLGLTRITLLPLVLTLSRIIQRRVVTLSCALYDAVCGPAMRPFYPPQAVRRGALLEHSDDEPRAMEAWTDERADMLRV